MFLSPVNQLCSTSEEAVLCFLWKQPLIPNLCTYEVFLMWQMIEKCEAERPLLTAGVSGISTLLKPSCRRCWIHSWFCSMHQLSRMVLIRVSGSVAVLMGKGGGVLCFRGGNGIWGNRLQRRQEIKAGLKGSAVLMTRGIMSCNMGRGRCSRQFFLMAPHCIYASNFPCCTFQQSSWWC